MSSIVRDVTCRKNHREVESWCSLGELGYLWTDRLFGLEFRRERVLVREGGQRDVPPLQEALILVRFAQLHALRDPLLPKFLRDIGHSESTRRPSRVRGSSEASTYCWVFALVLEFGDALVSDVFCGHGGVNALRTRPPAPIPPVDCLFPPPHLTLYTDSTSPQVKSINPDDGAPLSRVCGVK